MMTISKMRRLWNSGKHAFPKRSLGFRLIIALILIVAVVLTAYTLFAVFREQQKVRTELTNKGELLTNLLAYSSRTGVFAENTALLKDVAAGIVVEPDVVQVGIYNAERRPLYLTNAAQPVKDAAPDRSLPETTGDADQEAISMRETDRALAFTKAVILRIVPNEDKTLYFGHAGPVEATQVIGYVRVMLQKEALHREIVAILRRNALIALIFIGASIILVYLQVKKTTRPLETLTQKVKAMAEGRDVALVTVETGDEIGRLERAFNTMLYERKVAEQALQNILMDIHDGIGGITTNICILTEIAQKASSPTDINNSLTTIAGLARDGMVEIRNLMYSLDRGDLNWSTLVAELRQLSRKFLDPHMITFDLVTEIDEACPEPRSLMCLNLFRIYRETLTNVIKHAQAKTVKVSLRVTREHLALQVRDDGRGCDRKKDDCGKKGRGISNMKARAAEIGGKTTIIWDNGTCVSVEMPLSIKSLQG